MGCEPQDARWRSVIKSRNIPMVERNEKQSTLTVLARESGFYRCGGSNKVGKHEQVIPFYATGESHFCHQGCVTLVDLFCCCYGKLLNLDNIQTGYHDL